MELGTITRLSDQTPKGRLIPAEIWGKGGGITANISCLNNQQKITLQNGPIFFVLCTHFPKTGGGDTRHGEASK